MKKYLAVAFLLLFIGLSVIPLTSASLSYVSQNTISDNQAIVGIPIELTSSDATVSTVNFVTPHLINPSVNPLSHGTDVLVWQNAENDCQNPAIVTDGGFQNILVFTEIIRNSDQTALWGRWSTDGGVTWSDDTAGWDEVSPIQGDYDDVSQPRLDYYGEESWAYGTWIPGSAYQATIYYLELPSIVDPSYDPNGYGWVYYFVDWSEYDYYNFDSADVGCFPYDPDISPNAHFWGIIAGTGDRPPGENEEDNTMWLSFFTSEGVTIISFPNLNTDVEKMTCDLDMSLGRFYMAMEYEDEGDPTNNGTRFTKAPDLQPGDDWWQGSFPSFLFADVYNPDIAATDGSVYIVGETEVDGHMDIVCLYSSDAGVSFQTSTVTTTNDDEVYPSITVLDDYISCTYIRDGNLHVSISQNGGVEWQEAEYRLNDEVGSVNEQYGSHSTDGPYVAWTGKDGIYFDRLYNQHPAYLDITIVPGFHIGVLVDIVNYGCGPGQDIGWKIDIDRGIIFHGRCSSGIIDLIPIEGDANVKSKGVFGFGNVKITATAEPSYGEGDQKNTNGFVLGPFVFIPNK